MRTKIDKRDARLDLQRAEMLEKQAEAANLEENQKQKDFHNIIMESAYASTGSFIHNKRVKEQARERSFTYNEHFTTLALTEILSECVEKSLLLNTEEYEKLNPNYKAEIRSTVKGFLENAEINDKIDNKITLSLYEAIQKEIPLAELYLTEEDELGIVSDHIMNKDTVNRGLDQLSRDVKVRVANLVTKDQSALADEQDVLTKADDKELSVAPMVPAQPEQPAEDEHAPIADPDQPVEEVPQDQQQMEAQPVIAESARPQLKIVKEQTKRGIMETLAINEATNMISAGKAYDKTLALANALKYVTILECLDASGIVSIGQEGYNRILSASGVNMNPVPRVNVVGAAVVEKPVATVAIQKDDGPIKVFKSSEAELPEATVKDKKVNSAISDLLKDAIPEGFKLGNSEEKIFEPFKKWREENPSFGQQLSDIPTLTEDLKGKYTNMKGEVFTESALRAYFEKEGFDLTYVDFEDLAESWHFKKH